ncbi:MAG: lipid-binding SYLF domain-containing protein [Betaproteobacteria bacterium]
MKIATLRNSMLGVCAASLVALAPAAHAQSEQQKLVNDAAKTFNNFVRDPDMTWFQKNAGRAKGFLIAPQVAKAGFIFGGSGGRAVLVARNPKTGSWDGPAFYVLATASVGFQAGISVSEVLTMVMTEKGLNSLLSTSVKLGGDASIAAGPVGVGAQGEVITDMVSFARAKGVYGGLNLDGTAVTISDDWNEAYYKKKVLPPDIIVTESAKNAAAAPLLSAVAKAAGGK